MPKINEKVGAPESSVKTEKPGLKPEEKLVKDSAAAKIGKEKVEAPKMEKEKVSKTPPGAWQAVKNFFNRRFSPISSEKYAEAAKIKGIAARVEDQLNEIVKAVQKAKLAENKISGNTPSDKSVQISEEYLRTANIHLANAKTILLELKSQESEANKLKEAHSAFDDLPESISKLEKTIASYELRNDITEKLLKLEKAQNNYQKDEKWENFEQINQEVKTLFESIKAIIKNSPLSNDPEIKKLNSEFVNHIDAGYLIKYAYPTLNTQFNRLFNFNIELFDKRTSNLNNIAQQLKGLTTEYHEKIKLIAYLESAIQDTSVFGRIYRFFHGQEKLERQLEQAKADKINVYKTIANSLFSPIDLEWIRTVAKLNPRFNPLKDQIEDIQKGAQKAVLSKNISDQLDNLIAIVKEPGTTDISPDVKALAYSLKTVDEKVDSKKQLEVVISAFPYLKDKAEALMKLISEKKLKDNFEKAFEEGRKGEMPEFLPRLSKDLPPFPIKELSKPGIADDSVFPTELPDFSLIQWASVEEAKPGVDLPKPVVEPEGKLPSFLEEIKKPQKPLRPADLRQPLEPIESKKLDPASDMMRQIQEGKKLNPVSDRPQKPIVRDFKQLNQAITDGIIKKYEDITKEEQEKLLPEQVTTIQMAINLANNLKNIRKGQEDAPLDDRDDWGDDIQDGRI